MASWRKATFYGRNDFSDDRVNGLNWRIVIFSWLYSLRLAQSLFLEINPFYPSGNASKYLVRDSSDELGNIGYALFLAKDNDLVAFLGRDSADVDHAQVHANIPYYGSELAMQQNLSNAIA